MSVIENGEKYGQLTVVSLFSGKTAKDRKYLCKCDCGGTKITSEDNLKRGHTKSYGCLYKGHGGSKKKNIFLGSNSKLYRTWTAMKQRCTNPRHELYENYGGRGIGICDEWANDYSAFKEWALANGYNENGGRNCSIDRIDVNGNYCPENCRWATAKEQTNNTRRNTIIKYNGQEKTLSQWADSFGINYSTFLSRLDRGWSMERIENTPIRGCRKESVQCLS